MKMPNKDKETKSQTDDSLAHKKCVWLSPEHRNAAAVDVRDAALRFPWLWPHPLALNSCLLLLQIDLSLMRVRTAVKK